jgi:hypothetical protein
MNQRETVTVDKAQDADVHEKFPPKQKGQIAIEPNLAPGLVQPTMGPKLIRRLKSR